MSNRDDPMIGDPSGGYPDLPMVMELGGEPVAFETIDEFALALSLRRGLPEGRKLELARLDDDGVLLETERVLISVDTLRTILNRVLADPDCIGRELAALGTTFFSEDHEWRSIFAALKDESWASEHQKLALLEYSEYLVSRQKALAQSRRLAAAALQTQNERQAPPSASVGERPNRVEGPSDFVRLPKGEPVKPLLSPGETLFLRLGDASFKIVYRGFHFFVDDNGEERFVQDGKNTVGRDLNSEVLISANYEGVSRTHLMIEVDGPAVMSITDMSKNGTFMPRSQVP